jgi:hypothetical protein
MFTRLSYLVDVVVSVKKMAKNRQNTSIYACNQCNQVTKRKGVEKYNIMKTGHIWASNLPTHVWFTRLAILVQVNGLPDI